MTDSTVDVDKAVAVLASERYSQKEIAQLLGVSQATVSRHLAAARRKGWLVTHCSLPKEDQELILRRVYPRHRELRDTVAELENASGTSVVTHVHVFMRRTDQSFGRDAADVFAERVPGVQSIGVAWGSTVATVVERLESTWGKRRRSKWPGLVSCFPLCGEPRDFPSSRHSASVNAGVLHQVLNGTVGEPCMLTGTPARVPRQLASEEQAAIWRFVRSSRRYQQVFGKNGLISLAESMLIGCGTTETRREDDRWMLDIAEAEGISASDLRALTIGDVAGVLVGRRQLSPGDQKLLHAMHCRWTGVSVGNLRDCASRAVSAKQPGVILVATGRAKSSIVCEAISMGLVNQMIIDDDLANGIIDHAVTA